MSGVTDDSVHYWKGRALAAERQRDDLRTRLMLAEEAVESEAGERAEAERERDELRAAVERVGDQLAHRERDEMRCWQERRHGGGDPVHRSYCLGRSYAFGAALLLLSLEIEGPPR